MEYIIVFCTTDNKENAELIAHTLVKEKLAACTNIIPQINSIYTWKEQIVQDEELLLLIKTRKELFEEVKNRILSLHNYEVPEIISVNINDGSKSYLDWIKENTTKKDCL